MRWDATHCQAGVKLDGATASHDTSSWDTVQCDTWLSSGVWDIVVKTQDVDRQSLFLGVVSREHWQTTEQKDEDGDPIEAPATLLELEDELPVGRVMHAVPVAAHGLRVGLGYLPEDFQPRGSELKLEDGAAVVVRGFA